MIFIFSKNRKIGSQLIRWSLGEPVSHFAVVFDEWPKGYGILFHAHFSGVSIEWFNDWQRHNEIVYAYTPVNKAQPLPEEEDIYQIFVKRFYGKGYDAMAFTYWVKCLFLHKLFGFPIPTKNEWGDPRKYLCYEIYEGLSDLPFLGLPSISPEQMISPYQLKLKLEKSPYIEDVSYRYRG